MTNPRNPAHQYQDVAASIPSVPKGYASSGRASALGPAKCGYYTRQAPVRKGSVLRCRTKSRLLSLCACLVLVSGCRSDKEKGETEDLASTSSDDGAELIFPEALRVGDESVNQFVRAALTQAATGDYEAFRSLWSAKREPISRKEFEEGWNAVRRVEVRGLQKVLLEIEPKSDPETVYALRVEVSLDPQARPGQRAPLREVVLMLVWEHEQWKLAPAPKDMRAWIKQRELASPP